MQQHVCLLGGAYMRVCMFVCVYIVHVGAVLYVWVCVHVCAIARALSPCLFVLRVF